MYVVGLQERSKGFKDELTEQLKYVTLDPVFSYGNDPKANNIYFSVSDFTHTDLYCPYYFYNSLKVMFK